jgi:hypothetical protein
VTLRALIITFFIGAMSTPFAYSHTFGIGLRAGDSGGIEVWYRSWHACDNPLFEGEIKIEGINGTTFGPISAPATLSSCDSAGGTSTFPVFEATNIGYYCEVDSSGQILNDGGSINSTAQASLGSDPANPATADDMGESLIEDAAVGAILCNEDLYDAGSGSDMWQGSAYTGLAAGEYRVTYVPCDADGDGSDCYDGEEASADWDVDRNLVRSTPITISTELAAAGTPTGVPTLPLFGLLTLGGLLGLFGLRKLKK